MRSLRKGKRTAHESRVGKNGTGSRGGEVIPEWRLIIAFIQKKEQSFRE
ncbi:hypothetical protein [Virgibacillus chiguensis]|uniref:Uncharacterized protein n=1 Tax=Virgibacillus chiguensis TaxID=411959 RepID=A0A1M5NSF3_9BACI|nr:hypothetical protein [Virgibacillus chiguensis]SHG92397.1 hypothetical protein SAMN05421807_102327 [Virgibacillus chiguensis]